METNSNSSSRTLWVIIGIIVVIIVIWLIIRGTSHSNVAATPVDTGTSQAASAGAGTNQVGASANDSSNASISQDTSNIDTQLNGLNSDNASADQSLNSKSQ